jgi:hypothetical protein
MKTGKNKKLQGGVIDEEDFSFDALIGLNREKVDFDEMFALGTEGDLQKHFDFQTMPNFAKPLKGVEV